jgi:hypothetical protein
MPPLTDPEILCCYRNALSNWRFEGFVAFTERAREGLRLVLPGYSLPTFKELLYQHVVVNGGEIDQVAESREEWRDQ